MAALLLFLVDEILEKGYDLASSRNEELASVKKALASVIKELASVNEQLGLAQISIGQQSTGDDIIRRYKDETSHLQGLYSAHFGNPTSETCVERVATK